MIAGRIIALLVGILVLYLGAAGVVTGKVQVRAVVGPSYFERRKQPFAFWATVVMHLGLGMYIVISLVRHRAAV